MKKLYTSLLLIAIAMFSFNLSVKAETVKYTITSTKAVSTSGTAPSGSSATFSNTYTSNKQQIIKGKTQTLTLSGYDGKKITGITLSIHSNGSSGAGTITFKVGSGSAETLASGNFNTWASSYSTLFKDVVFAPAEVTIGADDNVVIKIAATTNSLYNQSFEITYTSAAPANPYTVSFNAGAGTYTGGDLTESSPGAGITLPIPTLQQSCTDARCHSQAGQQLP